VNPDGIPVTFGCPVYTKYRTGELTLPGGPKDYGLSMSTSRALGADGRLADPVALVSGGSATPPEGDQCAWSLGAGGSVRPQEIAGTYYWQAWRFCTGCESGYETGRVRTLTLTANAQLAVKPPKTLYAGYPFILPVAATGVANFTALTVLKSGGAKIGSGTVTSESASPTVTLGAGTTRIHAAVTLGAQTVTSPEVGVKAVKAKAWKTKATGDGAYKGTRSSKLEVAKRGREIRSLSVSVAMLCPTPGWSASSRPRSGPRPSRRPRSRPTAASSAWRPRRTRRCGCAGSCGRKLSGGVAELSVGTCSGTARFTAKRG
jgi:hypothetical protein